MVHNRSSVYCSVAISTLTHQEVIAKLILSNSIVVCQFSNKMVIFWTKANHCLAPLPIVGAVMVQDEGKVSIRILLSPCYNEFKVQL